MSLTLLRKKILLIMVYRTILSPQSLPVSNLSLLCRQLLPDAMEPADVWGAADCSISGSVAIMSRKACTASISNVIVHGRRGPSKVILSSPLRCRTPSQTSASISQPTSRPLYMRWMYIWLFSLGSSKTAIQPQCHDSLRLRLLL